MTRPFNCIPGLGGNAATHIMQFKLTKTEKTICYFRRLIKKKKTFDVL